MKLIAFFDLDGTVICSKHRHATKPDGSLDLEHWVENSTPEKIALDSLLPLVNKLRLLYGKGCKIVICTARVMKRADYMFLLNRNIPFDFSISRPKGNTQPDGEFKKERIDKLLKRLKIKPSQVEMYDDNDSVIAAVRSLGIACHDAKRLNK
jgi:hypothetical protein